MRQLFLERCLMGTDSPPTTELVSVEERSQPAFGSMECAVTTLLASVERCFHCVLKETSPDGGKLRRGVVKQSKDCLVMNMARRAQGLLH